MVSQKRLANHNWPTEGYQHTPNLTRLIGIGSRAIASCAMNASPLVLRGLMLCCILYVAANHNVNSDLNKSCMMSPIVLLCPQTGGTSVLE